MNSGSGGEVTNTTSRDENVLVCLFALFVFAYN